MEITIHLSTQHSPIRIDSWVDVVYFVDKLVDYTYEFQERVNEYSHEASTYDEDALSACGHSRDSLVAMKVFSRIERLIFQALTCRMACVKELGVDYANQLEIPLDL